MEGKLFRKVALDRLSSPEQLDEMMKITNPKGWLALGALGALITAILAWGIFGNVPLLVVGEGILTRGGALTLVQATGSGTINILIDEGALVQKGQTLAVIGENKVTSPISGRVLQIIPTQGDEVSANSPLMNLESTDNTVNPLQAVIYVAPTEGSRIEPGMTVQISPITVRREEYGYMIGVVKSVSEAPASTSRIARMVGDEEFARSVSANGFPTEVQVELLNDETVSGYKWSSSKGPDFKLQSGTFASATIVIGDRRPISLVFGLIPLSVWE